MSKLKKMITDSRFANKEIKPDISDSSEVRWESKEVKEFKMIHECNDLENVSLNGIGSIEVSDERSHSNGKSILLSTTTEIEDIKPRPYNTIVINIDKENWTEYNRISLWVYPESTGFQNFYFHFTIFNEDNKGQNHAPSLVPNKWNHIIWETTYMKRDSVIKFGMSPFLMGCPPEAEYPLRVFFDDIQLQKVDPDFCEGWDLNERIAYCHSGYFHNSNKVALTQKATNDTFKIVDESDNDVFTSKVEQVSNDIGNFFKLDFTDFKRQGQYYLKIDDRKTPMFDIDDLPYKSAIWKSLNFLRMLRCGCEVEEVHSPCHLNDYTLHPDGRLVPNHGGWHDAGDVSQFQICTAEMAHSLLDLAEKMADKDQALTERLLEEARWGLNWLLRTRFGDGYRALAVHYSIWRKNIVKSRDMFDPESPLFRNNVAENGPFENFLAAACEAVAARVFKEIDPIFASWCLRSAQEDFTFGVEGHKNGLYTKRWGLIAESLLCGHGALAAAEIYSVTSDDYYLSQGDIYSEVVLACQQSELPSWDIPIRGFFYEDTAHTKLLTFEHRGHEQSPIQGLTRLCEVSPDHPSINKWKNGLKLYAEYIYATSDKVAPYNLLPAHIYQADKLNMIRFTIPKNWATQEEAIESFKEQIADGIRLNENVYLRRFPIAIQRRGFHATLLSKVKGVTAIGKLLNDQKLMQVGIDQLEWILGKNPFASSSMYGEGNNYHPLYVAFSRQMVGALPVGFETFGEHDAPFWPVVNNAVYKEIWGHTTGKFLWVLADLI